MTPEWESYVQVGDVLRRGDTFRVVRAVHREPGRPNRTAIHFAIRRRSWTRRPYTVYFAWELADWQHTGKRVTLTSELDRRIALEITLPPTYRLASWEEAVGLP